MLLWEHIDKIIISVGTIVAAFIPIVNKIRKVLDSNYKTARDIRKEMAKDISDIKAEQQHIRTIQTAVVQETLSNAAVRWTTKGYIPPREKQALNRMVEAYYAGGGNDLAEYFWGRIEELPVQEPQIQKKERKEQC